MLLLCLVFASVIELVNGRFVAHTSPGAAASLLVFVDTSSNDLAVLGTVTHVNGDLVFTPKYPLQPGIKYRVELRANPPVIERFEIPREKVAAPKVVSVFPSADHIPENQLKIYLQFSQPMARGEAYKRIRLLNSDQQQVELPFLELDQELWDPSGTRLTLLFDPGRIKRGLVPNQEAGPPLEAGKRYALVVEAGWPDAAGNLTTEEVRRLYTVTAADREPPDPARWKINPPKAGTREPLTVQLAEALDAALLEHLLSVEGVPGIARVDSGETRWSFTPRDPWTSGTQTLRIDTALEDLAGNRIGRPFDVDRFEKVDREVKREYQRLTFAVR